LNQKKSHAAFRIPNTALLQAFFSSRKLVHNYERTETKKKKKKNIIVERKLMIEEEKWQQSTQFTQA
jgi:hypothetical protein